MNVSDFIALARSYDGCSARDERYIDLLLHPGDPPERRAYYADPSTSSCALAVLGLWRLAGVRHHLLTDAYRTAHATADMRQVAEDLGAYHSVVDVLRGRYAPKPGDAAMIVGDDGRREHAFTIVDVQETEIGWRIESVDGGHSIKAVRRIWRRGPGRIVDDVDGRLVAYVVDVGALLAASGPPGGGAGDTEPAPAPAPDSVADATPTEPAPYLLGVDVSRCQEPQDVDWARLALTHRFAIIKASEALERDPRCVEHVTRARPHLAHLGLYMVPHQDPPAGEQVRVFREAAAAAGLDGPGHILPVLDLEGTVGRTPERYGATVREIAELLGEVMIYLSPSFYLWMGSPEWLRDYPWWVAHYTDKPQPWCPWVEWAIWQHRVAPIEGYHGKDPKTGEALPIDQNRARRLPTRDGSGTGYL